MRAITLGFVSRHSIEKCSIDKDIYLAHGFFLRILGLPFPDIVFNDLTNSPLRGLCNFHKHNKIVLLTRKTINKLIGHREENYKNATSILT